MHAKMTFLAFIFLWLAVAATADVNLHEITENTDIVSTETEAPSTTPTPDDAVGSGNDTFSEEAFAFSRNLAIQFILGKMLRALGPDYESRLPSAPTNATPHLTSRMHVTTGMCPTRFLRCSSQTFFPSCAIPRNTDEQPWNQRFTLFFNISSEISYIRRDSILSVTLRLYKNISLPLTRPQWLIISLYAFTHSLMMDRERSEFIGRTRIESDYVGDVFIVVPRLMRRLRAGRIPNHGFKVTVVNESGVPWNIPDLFVKMDCQASNESLLPLPFEIKLDNLTQRYPALNIRSGTPEVGSDPVTYANRVNRPNYGGDRRYHRHHHRYRGGGGGVGGGRGGGGVGRGGPGGGAGGGGDGGRGGGGGRYHSRPFYGNDRYHPYHDRIGQRINSLRPQQQPRLPAYHNSFYNPYYYPNNPNNNPIDNPNNNLNNPHNPNPNHIGYNSNQYNANRNYNPNLNYNNNNYDRQNNLNYNNPNQYSYNNNNYDNNNNYNDNNNNHNYNDANYSNTYTNHNNYNNNNNDNIDNHELYSNTDNRYVNTNTDRHNSEHHYYDNNNYHNDNYNNDNGYANNYNNNNYNHNSYYNNEENNRGYMEDNHETDNLHDVNANDNSTHRVNDDEYNDYSTSDPDNESSNNSPDYSMHRWNLPPNNRHQPRYNNPSPVYSVRYYRRRNPHPYYSREQYFQQQQFSEEHPHINNENNNMSANFNSDYYLTDEYSDYSVRNDNETDDHYENPDNNIHHRSLHRRHHHRHHNRHHSGNTNHHRHNNNSTDSPILHHIDDLPPHLPESAENKVETEHQT